MSIELLNVDCMDYLKSCPDKSFQLAICDPPYGINISGQKETKNTSRNPKQNRKHHEDKGWDSTIPDSNYFRQLERVSKKQILWGGNYFVEHLRRGHKGWIVWDKGQHGLTMSDCELAYSSFDIPTRVWVQNRCILNQEGTIHPTQKPVKLYEWLLANYAKEGDKILDTHLGSGSSAIAAHYGGFDFVGCELDEDYYNASMKRFDNETRQIDLLGEL
jgi:site-specific DNA-methyltransferase (adenine-specific)